MTGELVDLGARRAPVCYSVDLVQFWDDSLEVRVRDVAGDPRSRASIADALRRAADMIENDGPG